MSRLDFGDYELIQEIGRGGMGVVYKARQRSLNRIVALKMILSGRFAGRESIERLRAEAMAAAALQHPNIVAIHMIGEVEGQHYFTMDFIEGRSLAQVIYDLRFTMYDSRRSVRWVKVLAEAIHYAHQHGILHRDLKPSNVLIDPNDQPRITDFGLAKRLGVRQSSAAVDHVGASVAEEQHSPAPAAARESGRGLPHSKTSRISDAHPSAQDSLNSLSATGHPVGSPSFMPPEQVRGQRNAIGPRSDIYSLGALLYHLLTGRAPFAAATMEATLAQVLNEDPVPLRRLNPDVPADLETICLKCLEKEPARRYATARQLAEDLGRFENDEPISARPVTASEKLWRWARRNPRVATLTISLLMVFLAGLAGVSWQWRRAERHAATETQQRLRAEALVEEGELRHVEELLRVNDTAMTLARLARLLRWNPTNRIAAERVMALLVQRDFAFPLIPALQHDGPVTVAEFSPDGRLIVTASQDGTARLWDSASGQLVGTPMRHGAAVRSVRFNSRGDQIVTASTDKTARVWDARTGEPLAEPIQHRTEVNSAEFRSNGADILTLCNDGVRVWRVAKGQPERRLLTVKQAGTMSAAHFSPDGALVVTVNSGSVRVWRMDTGEPMSKPMAHPRPVRSASFSPDSHWLVTACDDGAARIWDIATGGQRGPRLQHGDGWYVEAASFSPDGRHVVTGSRDRTAQLWDAATGQPAGEPLQHTTTVLAAQFSADGKRLVTTALDNTAYIWDIATGKLLVELVKHPGPVNAAIFSPDGQRLVTACLDGRARLWDLRPGALEATVLRHRGIVRFVHFHPDGWRVVTASDDGTARLWDARTGHPLLPSMLHSTWVMNAWFSPDGSRLLTASLDRTLGLWDATMGREIFPRMTNGSPVRFACFSPDGRVLAAACDDGGLRLWSADTGQLLGEPLQHPGRLWQAAFSPDARRLVTACGDGATRLWDVATRSSVGKRLQHGDSVPVARFSPDGSKVVTASADQTARLWDARTGEPLGESLRHLAHVRDAVVSPDGYRVATASLDNTARLWEAASGRPLTEPLRHEAEVYSVQFSQDGRRLLTAAFDGTARLWDCSTGHPTCEPLRHGERVYFATFSPDGQRIATASADGTARLWELPMTDGTPPRWLPELAEAVAGQRLNAAGLVEPVEDTSFWRLKAQLTAAPPADSYTRWAQWLFADRGTRAISPSSRITASEHTRQ